MKAKVSNNNVQKASFSTRNHADVNANWVHWKAHVPLNHVLMVDNVFKLTFHHTHANAHLVSMERPVN
jgi:hypothetical protein